MPEKEGQQTFCSVHRVWDFCSPYTMPDALIREQQLAARDQQISIKNGIITNLTGQCMERDRRIAELTEELDTVRLRAKSAEGLAERAESHLAALLRAGEPVADYLCFDNGNNSTVPVEIRELRALAAALEKAREAKP